MPAKNKCFLQTCLERPLKSRSKLGFQDQLSLNAGQNYCIMQYFGPALSDNLSSGAFCNTFDLHFKIHAINRSLRPVYFEWPFMTGFIVIFLLVYSRCVTVA